jgi:hypothetical protein
MNTSNHKKEIKTSNEKESSIDANNFWAWKTIKLSGAEPGR